MSATRLFQVSAWPQLPGHLSLGAPAEMRTWAEQMRNWCDDLTQRLDAVMVKAAAAVGPTFGNQAANLVFAGPASGGAVQPAFRSLVVADLPIGYPYGWLSGVPASYTPSAHAVSHQYGGSDALAGQSIAGLRSSDSPTFASLVLGALGQVAPATDSTRLYLLGGSAFGTAHGANVYLCGNTCATNYEGTLYLGAGNPGTSGTYDGKILLSAGGVIQGILTSTYLWLQGALYPGNQTLRGLTDNGSGLLANHLQVVDDGSVVTLSRA